MSILLPLLAIAGVLGVGRFLLKAAFAVARNKLEHYVTSTVATTRAQQGDLTALTEAREGLKAQQRRHYRAKFEMVGLAALLLVPALTPYTLMTYAFYNVFWIPALHARVRR